MPYTIQRVPLTTPLKRLLHVPHAQAHGPFQHQAGNTLQHFTCTINDFLIQVNMNVTLESDSFTSEKLHQRADDYNKARVQVMNYTCSPPSKKRVVLEAEFFL